MEEINAIFTSNGQVYLTAISRAQVIVSITSESFEKINSVLQNYPEDILVWRDSIQVGDQLDAIFWPTGLWQRVTVVDMDHRYTKAIYQIIL